MLLFVASGILILLLIPVLHLMNTAVAEKEMRLLRKLAADSKALRNQGTRRSCSRDRTRGHNSGDQIETAGVGSNGTYGSSQEKRGGSPFNNLNRLFLSEVAKAITWLHRRLTVVGLIVLVFLRLLRLRAICESDLDLEGGDGDGGEGELYVSTLQTADDPVGGSGRERKRERERRGEGNSREAESGSSSAEAGGYVDSYSPSQLNSLLYGVFDCRHSVDSTNDLAALGTERRDDPSGDRLREPLISNGEASF